MKHSLSLLTRIGGCKTRWCIGTFDRYWKDGNRETQIFGQKPKNWRFLKKIIDFGQIAVSRDFLANRLNFAVHVSSGLLSFLKMTVDTHPHTRARIYVIFKKSPFTSCHLKNFLFFFSKKVEGLNCIPHQIHEIK